MTAAAVKDLLFKEFEQWMAGQTVSAYDDGEANYYEADVRNFVRRVHRLVVQPAAGITD